MAIHYFPSAQVETDWICCICHESDPADLVAHGGLGIKHPIHRVCMLAWLDRSSLCPSCKAEIAFRRLLPSIKNLGSPIVLAGIGVICALVGWKCRLSSLSALGLSLHSTVLHQAILDEEERIRGARQINALCQELLHSFSHEKFAQLTAAAATRSKYWRILSPWVSFEERTMKLVGVKTLHETIERDLLINQLLRLYRTTAMLGALFFAAKSLPRKNYDDVFRIFVRCFSEWTINN